MESKIKIIKNPPRSEWKKLMQRAALETQALHDSVAAIISEVQTNGDKALRDYSLKFDGVKLGAIKVTDEEFVEADSSVSASLKDAIATATANISKFHAAQRMADICVETIDGVKCVQKAVPISKVGLYIPGGNSPLFSTVLMLAVPAKIAGCKEIVLTTPPDRDGKIHPAILFAAKMAGVTDVFKVGGAQAIAAMAFGTQSIPKVYKIFGPGNRFVMEAKKQVSTQAAAIDMPAGPSEVMIIADGSANPEYVASDFLSQAEHGPDSQSILLTTSEELAEKLPEVIDRLLSTLPRQEMMCKSLSHSHVILLGSDEEMMEFANGYAPEHLIINHQGYERLLPMVENAGSVFVGPYSPESAGDYASGTNHTLPTSGYAKAYSGVNLDSFIKKITFQHLTREGLDKLAPAIVEMAENEELMAHALAVKVRTNTK